MRIVKYKDFVKSEETGKFGFVYVGTAKFHQWGVEFTEFENGPGNSTVAIIELETGEIKTVYPQHIEFIS